jgi:hypothetical protein
LALYNAHRVQALNTPQEKAEWDYIPSRGGPASSTTEISSARFRGADYMSAQHRRIVLAAKNTDSREHDIADSESNPWALHGMSKRLLEARQPGASLCKVRRLDPDEATLKRD